MKFAKTGSKFHQIPNIAQDFLILLKWRNFGKYAHTGPYLPILVRFSTVSLKKVLKCIKSCQGSSGRIFPGLATTWTQ